MGFPEMVVALAGIGMVTTIVTQTAKTRRRGSSVEIERLTGIVESLHADMGKMRDRVATLEKLATDGDRSLASEIERLRRNDPPSPQL